MQSQNTISHRRWFSSPANNLTTAPSISDGMAPTMTAEERLAQIALVAQDPNLTAEERNAKITAIAMSTGPATNGVNGANATGADMTPEQKFELITSNLQETLDPQIIKDVLNKDERPLCIYWGTATTGRPHCGYFVPMMQIASFLRAGCKVKILLADIHGFLDNLKAPIELVKFRAEYYRLVIIELLKAVGVPIDRLEFVLGSSYQLSAEYQMDLLRLCTIVTLHDAKKAGSEVVKQVENATLSGMIYPLMQALDEEYLGVDAQFGGVDQRKIFTLAKDILPKVGYKERGHLMNAMVPGLAGGKMSASDPDSKIDVLDAPDVVQKKIKKSFAVPRETEGNGILAFIQHVLLPAGAIKNGKPRFVIDRQEGEPLVYDNIEKLHEDYRNDVLTPQLVKQGLTKALNELLAPVQEAYSSSKEWQELAEKAYPPPPSEKKVKPPKKPKDKGTRTPVKNVEAQPDGSVEGKEKERVDVGKNVGQALNELELERKNLNG